MKKNILKVKKPRLSRLYAHCLYCLWSTLWSTPFSLSGLVRVIYRQLYRDQINLLSFVNHIAKWFMDFMSN